MLTFWPRIGETETLYSISARLHYLRGCNSSELTSKWLYGFATAAGLKDIPRNLGHLTETVQGLLGTAPEALRQRTLVGLYLRFMEPAPAQHFLDWCVSPRSAIRPYVGLRATGLPAQHPLRACPDCMVVDRDTLGCATWRLEHQLPAVLVCPWHGRVLHTVQRSVGSKRDVENTWVRPEDVSCQGRFMGCAIADEDMQWWTEFARSAWLLQSHPRASTEVLRTILSTRLAHIGVIPSGRKLDLQALEPWWVKRRPPNIGAYPGLASFSASTWIRDLLLRRRFGHPVR